MAHGSRGVLRGGVGPIHRRAPNGLSPAASLETMQQQQSTRKQGVGRTWPWK